MDEMTAPYVGFPVYYALYDFCEDGIPELLISLYNSDSDGYIIIDIYGIDGTTPVSVIDESVVGTRELVMCEGNILRSFWSSGGMSTNGMVYFRLGKRRRFGKGN